MPTNIKNNIERVRAAISAAAKRAGRSADDIKLVAVSKMHPVSAIDEAIAAGTAVFGENKVQEAEGKIAEVGKRAEWHLIGHLQSNKARKAAALFDVIHSVDSLELAQRLERICIEDGRDELRILVHVDLAGETTKSGIAVSELDELVNYLASCKRLRFDGLMVLPPYFEDAELTRPYFAELRGIRDRLQEQGAFGDRVGELSMGMSHDLDAAIQEGATMVRVGTAIFGEREYPQ